MKLTLEYVDGKPALEITSEGHGRYKIKSDRPISRKDGVLEYETDDGLHVLGLIQLYFGSLDSLEYLRRRLEEQVENRG
jgi:hypothetical protein